MNPLSSIRAKLALVVLPFLLPVGLFAVLYLNTAWEAISSTLQEKRGVEYVTAARKLINHFARHRGLVNGYLGGDASLKERIEKEEVAITAAIQATDEVNDRYGAELKVEAAWTAIRADWALLRERALRMKPAASFAEHTQLIKKVFELTLTASEASTLTLDPEVESCYLQDTAISRLFYVTENLGQLRGTGTGFLSQKVAASQGKAVLTPQEKAVLEGYSRNITIVREMIGRNLESAFRARPSLHKELDDSYLAFSSSTDNFLEYLQKSVLEPETVGEIGPKQFFDTASKPIDASLVLADTLLPVVVKLLDERVARNRSRIQLAFAGIGVSLLTSFVIAFLVSRGLLRQVKAMNDTFFELGVGNFEARVAVVSNDELGKVAQSLNGVLDSMASLLDQPDFPEPATSRMGFPGTEVDFRPPSRPGP